MASELIRSMALSCLQAMLLKSRVRLWLWLVGNSDLVAIAGVTVERGTAF